MGQILSPTGNNYTTQLFIPPTPETAERTVECFSDNGTDAILLFSSVIPTPGLSLCVVS